jgi:hypothetical protein
MLRMLFWALLFQGSLWAEECSIILVPHNRAFQHWWYDRKTDEGFLADLDMHFKAPFRGSLEFAACLVSDAGKKWRVPAAQVEASGALKDISNMAQGGGYGGGIYFQHGQTSKMDVLGDGTFLFAILVDGKRCSNVIRVTIQHDYDAKLEPALRVFAIQPQEGDALHQLGVWIVPPVLDKKLTNFAASSIDLSIDGGWHTAGKGIWIGFVYPLHPGRSDVGSCFFESYSPPIAPFSHAKVQARLLGYTSSLTDISFDPADSRHFDHAFELN